MADKIKLVQGNTRPQLIFSCIDEISGTPINLGDPGTTVSFKFRQADATALKATMPCNKLAGMVLEDGSITYEAPYNIPGSGGRVFMEWTPDALDTPGDFEGELEVTFGDGTKQTVYDVLKFRVREQL